MNKQHARSWVLILGGLLTATTIGYGSIILAIYDLYIIGLTEVFIGIVIGHTVKHLIVISNYTRYLKIKILLVTMSLVILFTSIHALRLYLLDDYHANWDFLKARINAGLVLRGIDLGSLGLFVYWIVKPSIIYYVSGSRIKDVIIKHLQRKVPAMVFNFVRFHVMVGVSKIEIRKMLSARGWTKFEDQEHIFELIRLCSNQGVVKVATWE